MGLRAGILAAMVVIAAVVCAGGAQADTRLNSSNQRWQASDKCLRNSFKKFPDYTVEGATQRDLFVRECLRNYRLPPRADMAPQSTQQQQPQQ